jgi:hypothetical protein
MSKEMLKKEAVSGTVQASTQVDVSEEELKLINSYTRRELSADEVYVFSVVLCDNDVDRDGERFTVESLFALEKLFVGKTGIIDHNPSAKNQTARIFFCEVEAVDGMKTATGDDYFRLKARAYMPKSEKNSEVILALDSGIIKEVSVGCAVEKTVCSICGEDIANCPHKKGETYGSKLCCGELVDPIDAYEWSFVAVPSQKRAGVTKAFERKEMKMEEILKNLESEKGFVLSDKDCKSLKNYVCNLKQSAKDGVFYRDSLVGEVLRLSAVIQPDISRDTMESITKSMTVAQLKEVKTAFEKQQNQGFANVPQLYSNKNNKKTDANGQFRI